MFVFVSTGEKGRNLAAIEYEINVSVDLMCHIMITLMSFLCGYRMFFSKKG